METCKSGEFPCKDCICLAMCKSNLRNITNWETTIIDATDLCRKCDLFNEWWELKDVDTLYETLCNFTRQEV